MDSSESGVRTAGADHETKLLLTISKTQSQQAYAELFDLMAPKIKSFLMGRGSSDDESENITQDAMLSVWRKADLFDPAKSSARTWVYAIVRNRMIDLQRTATRINKGVEKYKHEAGVDFVTSGGVTDASSRAQLQKLLQQLPENQAQALVMSYVKGKSHKEIAEEVGLPLGTVKSRIRTGFQHLQELVSQ
jgi:RNA polymerase sigma factor (sigma-70 family)|tara:strand:+ start:66 stop:638 length:573 start_codon:yes stop_codon:yes gene_type:complete